MGRGCREQVGWERLKGREEEKNRGRKKGTRRRKKGNGKEEKEMKERWERK